MAVVLLQRLMNAQNINSFDHFFDGRITIEQPMDGYRAGLDAVLLASAASAIAQTNICELGCGAGVAIIGAMKLNPNINRARAIELDPIFAGLCAKNLELNQLSTLVEVINQDGLKPNSAIEGEYDLVISNPPFFDNEDAIRGPKQTRKGAYIIGAPLADWLKAMLRLASAKGEILLIHRADRLDDILSALKNRACDIRIFPIRTRANAPANRIIIRAKKASRAPTQIFEGLNLYSIEADNSYSDKAKAIFAGQAIDNWGCLK